MSTIVFDEASVTIPPWVVDHDSFRRWVHSSEFPETGRICFLGEVWLDMSKEQVFSHNQVKNEYGFVLTGLSKTWRRGRYFPDGVLLTNVAAGLTSRPDGIFVAQESWDAGRVTLVEGADEGFVELEGSPDMVLEVLSPSSVKKDMEILFDLYWQAEIQEYWLVDARGQRLSFDIFRHTAKGYQAVRKQGGWLKSAVFGKAFRFLRTLDERSEPVYTLEVK